MSDHLDSETELNKGRFVEHDLVMMITPDGRMHCGRITTVFEGDGHHHFDVCHFNCNHNIKQWRLERLAHHPESEGP